MKTTLGPLTPAMVKQIERGRLAEVARTLVDQAQSRGDPAVADPARAVADLLGELQVLALQYAQNDKGKIAAKGSGVSASAFGAVAHTQGRRDVKTSALGVRLGAAVPKKEATLPSAEVATVLLAQIYARFPSLTVDLEPGRLAVAAEKVLGDPARVRGLVALLAQDKPTFLAARADALLNPAVAVGPRRHAVVSGLSNGGMVAVALLAKSGYRVDCFEQRSAYTRNIQYGGRQALLDQLASIDPRLAEKFLAEVGHHVAQGSVHTLNTTRRVHAMPLPERPDPTRVPETGEAMLNQASTVLMECKVFEDVLRGYIETLPNVTIHQNATIDVAAPDENGKCAVSHSGTGEDLGKPDLVIVAEGSNSSTFRSLGVKSVATSPKQRYIAGTVGHESHGVMAKHFRDVDGEAGPERVLIASMGNAGAGKTWVVAGVADGVTFDPKGLEPGSPEYIAEQKLLVEKEFKASAALVTETSAEHVASLPIDGPIAGHAPTLFTLQQRLSERATVGTNVIGFGDVVGNNHFSVGGGMQVAAISHGQRLKRLMFDIEAGIDRPQAMKAYNDGALEDSMAWGRRGICDFYPYVSWQEANKAYDLAVAQWRKGNAKDPLEALEKILSKRIQMLPAGTLARRTAA